jgi:hypothetical protein
VQTETPRPECTLTGRGDWASATGPATACIVAGGSSQVPRAQVVLDSRRKSRKNGNARRVHRADHQNNAAPDKGAAASHLRKGSKPPASARFAGWPLRKETSERELARTYEHLWQAYTGKIHERLDVGISGLRKVPWTPASASTARSANATRAMASASTTAAGVLRADEAQSDRSSIDMYNNDVGKKSAINL